MGQSRLVVAGPARPGTLVFHIQEVLTQHQVLVGMRLQHAEQTIEQGRDILRLKANVDVDLPPILLLEGCEGAHVIGCLVGLHPHARAEIVGLGNVVGKAEDTEALLQSGLHVPSLARLGVTATVGVCMVIGFHGPIVLS